MIIWGISAQSHDASISVLKNRTIVFAAHAERYSRKKNDPDLHPELVEDALRFGEPEKIVWYENPLLKYTRQLYLGRLNIDKVFPEKYVRRFLRKKTRFVTKNHHESHAAAGFFTSSFKNAAVLVVDAVGEWAATSIWHGTTGSLRPVMAINYPHSLGLFYSAMTNRCGLKPNNDEYILMGMAAFGDPYRFYETIKRTFFNRYGARYRLRHNLHWGCRWWMKNKLSSSQDYYDVAAATQKIYEEIVLELSTLAREKTGCGYLVLSGGGALNCVANSLIANQGWDGLWILPNPGDAGSSLGAIAASIREQLDWPGPYLGHEIQGTYPVQKLLNELLTCKITGVANGKAEFGPRALGNRSLLADPRGAEVKDLVNRYKQREPFRPFAPAILDEHAHRYFELPVVKSPYMQFVARCRRPDLFPAIVHVDGTSRVQTVDATTNTGLRKLLEAWYAETGCPMLLNTSLNIKNEPLVNTASDATRWSALHHIPVHCNE